MIDVSQWRASIGLWNYCQAASSRPAIGRHSHSFKAAVDSKSGSTTSGEKTSKLPAALSLIAFLLLLFLSLSLLRHILMIPPTGNCYQVQCTTGVTVTDTNYLQSVVLPGGSSSNLIYNDLYLIVCLRMLLLLSGDVELNPGPTIDDRPDISLLTQWLEPLVDWQLFACCLPGITQHDVSIIEAESSSVDNQKRKLYSKWLSVYPEATWNDVITALTIRRENTLAQNIKEMIEGHPSTPNDSNGAAMGINRIMFKTKKDEEEVLHSLLELNKAFMSLMTKVRTAFDKKVASDPKLLTDLTRWIETYMNWNDKLTNASLNEAFKTIHPYYDFIDCSLIVGMSEVFLKEFKFDDNNIMNIASELKDYKGKADKLRFSTPVKYLSESLKTIYKGHIPDTSNMPMISIRLHNPWHGSNINGLSLLIHNLLPVGHQQSIMKYITITTNGAPSTPAIPTVSSSVITKPVTDTTSGNTPSAILRINYATLVDAITNSLQKVTDALYAKELIPQQTKQEMLVPAVDDYTKAANLMNVIEKQLESSLNPEQYLIDICHVLINQQHCTLTDIATSILHQLGQSIPDNVSSHTVLPSPVDDIPNTPVEKKFCIEDLIRSGTLKKWCKEGIMELTLTRVLMIGPAGSGKTCAQHLLLNKPPLKQSAYSDPSTSSTSDLCTNTPSATNSLPTGLDIYSDSRAEVQSSNLITPHSIVSITDSTPIACKAIRALRIAFDGKETWKEITTDELQEKLASSLKEAAENAAQQRQSESLLVVPFLKESEDKQEETPEEHDNPVFKETADCETPRPGDEFKKIADLLSVAEAQLSEKWVYIVDSGGQPAYQELLPVFTRAATLNVITLNISKGIDEEFEFMYRINGQEFKCDKKMKYSNRKIFNSVVSSASAQKPIDIPFVKHQPTHSMSFVLGTHYDVLIQRTNKKDAEAKVVEMSEKLMSPTNILPHLECRIISKAYGNSVIHPVDTLQEDSVERTKNSRKILETMSKCTEVTMEIEVPMRCFVFELYLEEKTKNKGFVTKDEVIQSCKEDLYMSEHDVEIALKFLHNSTIILYYPEIEPQLVFVNPQKILDVLSHLLALTYVDYPTAQSLATDVTESEMKRLKKAGLFEQVLLEKFKKVFLDDFTPDYFINLLQHLHIISKLKSQVQVRDSYFLPSALPPYNNNYDITHVTTKPLYYVWLEQEDEWESKNAVLAPQGIFILFYVHLLEQKEYKVEFTRHSKCRDALSLWIYIEGKRCTLYIINCYEHIKVYFDGPKRYCPQVRELITTTINKSSDAINAKRNHAKAFPCPNKEEQCYCVVDEAYQVANCILCDSNEISEKDEMYWCWFGLKSDSGLADIKKDILLNTTHLHDVRMILKEGKFSNAEWFDFGLGLGLYYDTLKSIEKDYPRDTNGCVRECLVKWLEKADDVNKKGGAKWSTLIKALEDYNQNATADYIRSKTLK